jgi:hypothetical protein
MKKLLLLLVVGMAVFAFSRPANAYVLSFDNISNNCDEDVAGQFSVLVTDLTQSVSFKFTNIGDIESFIDGIYFADGDLFGTATISSSSNVTFSEGANPSELPGWNAYPWTSFFTADADNPAPQNGVVNTDDGSSWVTITFALLEGISYDDVIDDLNMKRLLIGLQVQGIGEEGCSDQFMNNGTSVPEPASMLLMGAGLIAFAVIRRKRNKA